VLNLQNDAFSVKYRQYLGFYMIILLSSLYIIYGFLFLYSYVKDIGLLRYLYAKKNINTLLTIELIFIIVTSFIVFTSQPMNWMVGLIMIFHIFGVVWIVAFPESFYSMYEESMSIDPGSVESMSGWILIGFGIFVYLSRIIT
jgi:hypothetical protein